jgi:hypothetical protein
MGRQEIRAVLDELGVLTEAMWGRRQAWEKAHPGKDRPLVCEGVGLIGRCTDTSVWLADRLGGQVYGYAHAENPGAELGSVEGGHDFVLIDSLWLVDWWAADTYQERDLYDLTDSADQEEVKRLYGDPSRWRLMDAGDFASYKRYTSKLREDSSEPPTLSGPQNPGQHTFGQAVKALPACVSWDPLEHKTVSDLVWQALHELDMFNEDQDGAITAREAAAVRRFVQKFRSTEG